MAASAATGAPRRMTRVLSSLVLLIQPLVQAVSPARPGITTRGVESLGFWGDAARVASLRDPPSAARLQQIRDAPWRGGLEPAEPMELHEVSADAIKGRIPRDLKGMATGNGAGRIRVQDRSYGHWFDGDGLVTMLKLDGSSNTASFGMDFVRTDKFLAQEAVEAEAGPEARPKLAKAGVWTKRGRGKWWENTFRLPQNPANTATQFAPGPDGPRLLALCEGGPPIEVDTSTLRTLAAETLEGPGGPLAGSYSAHFSRCPASKDVYNHGAVLRGAPPDINLVRMDASLRIQQQAAFPMPYFSFVHDSSLSQNHLAYVLCPYAAPNDAPLRFLAGQESLGRLYKWSPELDTILYLHRREDLSRRWEVKLPSMSAYHLVDAWEDEERFYLRTANLEGAREQQEAAFRDLYSADSAPLCHIHEYVVELATGTLVQEGQVATAAAPMEFPEVNRGWKAGKTRRRYVWTNTRTAESKWLDGIQKVDMQTGKVSGIATFGAGTYAGAPTFVAKEAPTKEDDGYIVTPVYRSYEHRTEMVILKASTLEVETRIQLDRHIPYQFHGDFWRDQP